MFCRISHLNFLEAKRSQYIVENKDGVEKLSEAVKLF